MCMLQKQKHLLFLLFLRVPSNPAFQSMQTHLIHFHMSTTNYCADIFVPGGNPSPEVFALLQMVVEQFGHTLNHSN